ADLPDKKPGVLVNQADLPGKKPGVLVNRADLPDKKPGVLVDRADLPDQKPEVLVNPADLPPDQRLAAGDGVGAALIRGAARAGRVALSEPGAELAVAARRAAGLHHAHARLAAHVVVLAGVVAAFHGVRGAGHGGAAPPACRARAGVVVLD